MFHVTINLLNFVSSFRLGPQLFHLNITYLSEQGNLKPARARTIAEPSGPTLSKYFTLPHTIISVRYHVPAKPYDGAKLAPHVQLCGTCACMLIRVPRARPQFDLMVRLRRSGKCTKQAFALSTPLHNGDRQMEAREDYSKIDYTIHKVVHGRSKGCKVLEIQFALLCGPIRCHLIHHGRVKRCDTDTAHN